MADTYEKRGSGFPKRGNAYGKRTPISPTPPPNPTAITSSEGDTPIVLDTGLENDVVTTLTLNQSAPSAAWTETSDPDNIFKLVPTTGTSVEVQLSRNLTSGDIGSSLYTAAVAEFSLDKSITVTVQDSAAPAVAQSFTLTNYSGGDLSGETIPFLTTVQFSHGEFDKATQRNALASSSGTLAASEMAHRTDGDGDTRLCVIGGVATPASFTNGSSITVTATVEAGAPTSGTAPTWASLLAIDSGFDGKVSFRIYENLTSGTYTVPQGQTAIPLSPAPASIDQIVKVYRGSFAQLLVPNTDFTYDSGTGNITTLIDTTMSQTDPRTYRYVVREATSTTYTHNLRTDGVHVGTFYSNPYCSCEIIRLPRVGSAQHRWVEAHVYIFKSDTDPLSLSNLVDVQVKLMLCASAYQQNIYDLWTDNFSFEMPISTEKYSGATSFLWRRYEADTLPKSTDAWEAVYSYLGAPTAVAVQPDLPNNRPKRYFDTYHVPNYHPSLTLPGLSTILASEFAAESAQAPFEGAGFVEAYGFGSTGERREFGFVANWNINYLIDPSRDAIKWVLWDSNKCRGHSHLFCNTTSTPRFMNAFADTGEGLLNTTGNNIGFAFYRMPFAEQAFQPDTAHYNSRNYIAYLLTGRYNHFYYMLNSAQWAWSWAHGAGVQKGFLTYYGQPRAQGRGSQPVVQMFACLPDDWGGELVGGGWSKENLDLWCDFNFGVGGTTGTYYGRNLQYRNNLVNCDYENGDFQTVAEREEYWMHGLSGQSIAHMRHLRIGPSTAQAGITDVVNRHAHRAVNAIMNPFGMRFWQSCSYYGWYAPDPYTQIDADDYTVYQGVPYVYYSARCYSGRHFATGTCYKTWAGVNATIDTTGGQSAVVITFSAPIFDMSEPQKSLYENCYATGIGMPIAVNATRSGTVITNSNGCGVITSVVSSTQCIVNTEITNFRYQGQQTARTLPLKSFDVATWNNVEMPEAFADMDLTPVNGEPMWVPSITVAAPTYACQIRGGTNALFDAATINLGYTKEQITSYWNNFYSAYSQPWPPTNEAIGKYATEMR